MDPLDAGATLQLDATATVPVGQSATRVTAVPVTSFSAGLAAVSFRPRVRLQVGASSRGRSGPPVCVRSRANRASARASLVKLHKYNVLLHRAASSALPPSLPPAVQGSTTRGGSSTYVPSTRRKKVHCRVVAAHCVTPSLRHSFVGQCKINY